MISMDEWFTIRTLKNNGMAIKQIARQLGLTRNTVRKYLRQDQAPRYAQGQRLHPRLRRYEDEIKVMLARGFIGSRILAELRPRGYPAPAATFYRQLQRIRAAITVVPDKAVMRFETPAGHQGQYDWSDYTVVVGGVVTKLHISSFILGYSRCQHYYASLDTKQLTIFAALEDSFLKFGGAPKEILFDNPKALVVTPRPKLVFNPHLVAFAGHYKFTPRACLPGRARTKGKVERPFQFLEERFLKGREFRSFPDLVAQLAVFEETVVNDRVHGTTRERPVDRLLREKHLLTPLPAGRFVALREQFRKVSWDCLISYGGSRYSVPCTQAGKDVWVRVSQGRELEVYAADGRLLARHLLALRSGAVVTQEAHYAGLRQRLPQGKMLAVKVFQDLFPEDRLFLEKLLAQCKFNATTQLRQILDLARVYPKGELRRAFQRALEYNTFTANFLKGLLHHNQPPRPGPDLTTLRSGPPPSVTIGRSLSVYQTLLPEKS